MPAQKLKATFTEPMLLLPARTLPEGANWPYELKLDGYRALAIKTDGKVHLGSRNNKDFNARYPAVANALAELPVRGKGRQPLSPPQHTEIRSATAARIEP